MDKNKLKDDLFYLLAFMLTSARGLYDEPLDYGVFRLLDASGRLLEIMKDHDLLNDRLMSLKNIIDGERESSMDNEQQRERLDEIILKMTREM